MSSACSAAWATARSGTRPTGEVLFSGTAPSTGGRRAKEFALNPNFRHVVQLTVTVLPEGYRICRKTCDLNGAVLVEQAFDSATCTEQDLVDSARAACAEDERIGIVCIANPGVSIAGKVVVSDAEGLTGSYLVAAVTDACGVVTVVENDVNAAAIGLWEDFRTESLALLYQPARYYVGVGMVIGGRLYNGASHAAGELRYLPFYTEEEQDAALAANPVELLAKQLATLNCVISRTTCATSHRSSGRAWSRSMTLIGRSRKGSPRLRATS